MIHSTHHLPIFWGKNSVYSLFHVTFVVTGIYKLFLGGSGIPLILFYIHTNTRQTTCSALGPIYTKWQRQHCPNSAMSLVILFSLKTVESLENGLQLHSGVTPLFQWEQNRKHHRIDAWYKWVLKTLISVSTCANFRIPRDVPLAQLCAWCPCTRPCWSDPCCSAAWSRASPPPPLAPACSPSWWTTIQSMTH